MSTDASLPSDLEACQRELSHVRSVLAETAVACEEQRTQIEKMRAELELFQRYLFGRRRERFVDSPGQGRLFDPPSEEEMATAQPEDTEDKQTTARCKRRGHGWGKLPAHLPREEVLWDVPESQRTCDCCGEPLVRIGEDRTERVDYRPAKIVIKVLVTPKYACPKKHGGVTQREAPPAPVAGGSESASCRTAVWTTKMGEVR